MVSVAKDELSKINLDDVESKSDTFISQINKLLEKENVKARVDTEFKKTRVSNDKAIYAR